MLPLTKRWRSVADDVVTTMPANVPTLLGSGYAAFTVDQGTENGRYQGIVELDGDTLSDAAMAWFANSEQVDSHIVASAAERDGTDRDSLMLQRVASDGGAAGTVQQKEIMTMSGTRQDAIAVRAA